MGLAALGVKPADLQGLWIFQD